MDYRTLMCCKCGVPLQIKEVTFHYLNFHVNNKLPACPSCGQVYIEESLAIGKMKEVEMSLEEK